jgi:Ca2+-transporting ATPase
MLHAEKGVKTPLQIRLNRFGRYLALAVLAICAVVFTAGLLQGQPLLLMFLTAISLAVAAIPEALPAVVTISLALGARKLIRHSALVRNLPAVETLGSVTCICADKTGTLTQNRMHAEQFYLAGQWLEALPGEDAADPMKMLGRAMALNNDVALLDGKPSGEPTELALFEAAAAAGYLKDSLQQALPRVATVPFDSRRKQMTTVHQADRGALIFVKGAPEQLLAQCQNALQQDGTSELPVDKVLAEAERLRPRELVRRVA